MIINIIHGQDYKTAFLEQFFKRVLIVTLTMNMQYCITTKQNGYL